MLLLYKAKENKLYVVKLNLHHKSFVATEFEFVSFNRARIMF